MFRKPLIPRIGTLALIGMLGGPLSGCSSEVTNTPSGLEMVVTESHRADGSLRKRTSEVVLGLRGNCEDVERRTEFFDAAGFVDAVMIDHRRCGVTDLRVVKDQDGEVVEVLADIDHDGCFDVVDRGDSAPITLAKVPAWSPVP